MLVASGATLAAASPAVLAACGAAESEGEETSPEREAELLNRVLAHQLAVIEAARVAGRSAPGAVVPVIDQLAAAREASTESLQAAISELEADAVAEAAATEGGESAVEGLARQLEAAIAEALEAIAELSPERRVPVHRAVTEDAAALAALRATLDEEPAPDAFVMGPPAARKESG